MPLHIIKNYTGKPAQRDGIIIDTTLKATRICKNMIADNLRLGNPELITVIVCSPSIFRHFGGILEHPEVSMANIEVSK